MIERIDAAAIRLATGEVIMLPQPRRHLDVIRHSISLGHHGVRGASAAGIVLMRRVGKRAAGSELDGVQHRCMPGEHLY